LHFKERRMQGRLFGKQKMNIFRFALRFHGVTLIKYNILWLYTTLDLMYSIFLDKIAFGCVKNICSLHLTVSVRLNLMEFNLSPAMICAGSRSLYKIKIICHSLFVNNRIPREPLNPFGSIFFFCVQYSPNKIFNVKKIRKVAFKRCCVFFLAHVMSGLLVIYSVINYNLYLLYKFKDLKRMTFMQINSFS